MLLGGLRKNVWSVLVLKQENGILFTKQNPIIPNQKNMKVSLFNKKVAHGKKLSVYS